MQIRIVDNVFHNGFAYIEEQLVELPESEAKSLVEQGFAEIAKAVEKVEGAANAAAPLVESPVAGDSPEPATPPAEAIAPVTEPAPAQAPAPVAAPAPAAAEPTASHSQPSADEIADTLNSIQ